MTNRIIQEDLTYIISNIGNWEILKNQTVLITGASGLLPHYFVLTLLELNKRNPELNIKIIALSRNMDKLKIKFKNYISDSNLILLAQDVCDPISYDKDINFIIHAASQASPKFFNRDPVGTLKPNTIGTYNLLEISRKKNVKSFLFISSGEVYGPVDESELPIEEKNFGNVNILDIRSCYAESKRLGENMCVSYFSQYSVPCKIARPFHTYGPHLDLYDKRVFADFVSNIVNNENIVMKSDGSATRDFCYLADSILAFFKVLLDGKNGEAYNIGRGIEVSILELAKLLVSLYPEKNLKVIQVNEEENRDLYLKSKISRHYPNVTKLKSLNWNPAFTLEEGFKRTIESFFEDK